MLRVYQYLFLIFIFILLIFPITKINDAERSDEENRMLARKYQSIFVDGGINLNFTQEFDNWFKDRFRGRDELVKLYKNINYYVLGSRIEDSNAFLGKDGWFFFKIDDSVADYQNIHPFTEEQLAKIEKNIRLRKEYLKKYDIDYYIIVMPAKNRIYGEYYPDYIVKKDNVSRTEYLVEYLKNKGLDIKYPVQDIMSEKDRGRIYYKMDTHWNTFGAFLGYTAIMKAIQEDYKDVKRYTLNDFTIENVIEEENDYINIYNDSDLNIIKDHKEFGDLIKVMHIDVNSIRSLDGIDRNTINLIPNDKSIFNYIVIKDTEDPIQLHIYSMNDNSLNKFKVVMLRDSFTTSMIPYIASSFSYVNYIWGHDFNNAYNQIILDKPNVVIEEIGERLITELLQEPIFVEEK
jgi:hypothetical protein